MAEASRPLLGPWLATARTARWLLVGATGATGVLAPARATFAGTEQVGPTLLWWILAAALVAVHLYHAFSSIGPRHELGSTDLSRSIGGGPNREFGATDLPHNVGGDNPDHELVATDLPDDVGDDYPDHKLGPTVLPNDSPDREFSIDDDSRPRGWPVTFALLTALVYVPMIWCPASWGVSQVFFVASAALLFRGTSRGILVTAPIVLTALGTMAAGVDSRHLIPTIEVVVVFTALAGCLVGATRLVHAVHQIDRTRTALAEQAADLERRRVSRDLHDLLGQSLSATSLKGDLAAALLPSDPDAARSEIQAIAGLARDTLQAMRRVTLGAHTISLHTEVIGATALLAAAGIDTHHHLDVPTLPPEVDNVFAWATREGVTNVLRHSAARSCSIVAGRRAGVFFLEIINDGAHHATGTGNGLAGLTERTAALSGTVSARHSADERFHLRVELPGGTP